MREGLSQAWLEKGKGSLLHQDPSQDEVRLWCSTGGMEVMASSKIH